MTFKMMSIWNELEVDMYNIGICVKITDDDDDDLAQARQYANILCIELK